MQYTPVSPPAVTAVIPALDESGRIARAVDRLWSAGVDEVVVVDGGSADGTQALAAARGARTTRSERGRARQMNAGAALARGEVLWFVHADVDVPSSAVAALRGALAEQGTVGGAFHTLTVDDRTPADPPRWMRLADVRQRYTRHPYGDQALFVWASEFRAAGGYREDLRMFEDVELCRRLWARGRLRIVDPPVQVSARRYFGRPVRSLVAMNLFPTLWRLGVPTGVLERAYGRPR